jgi:quercetin dioxygenase-like cupin family protein
MKEDTPMNRRLRLTALLALLFLTLGPSSVFGQAPPGPVVRYQFRTEGLPQPSAFNAVHSRVYFEPGAATPFHTHPGQVLVSVLDGEMTRRSHDGVDTVYKAGESWTERPNEVHQARNAGASRSSIMVTYLLPKDAPLSNPVPGDTTPPPRPFVSYQFRTDVQPMTDPFDVVQLVQDFEPGAATPFHTHPGVVVVTVLEGENTFSVNGVEKVYKAGESFVEVPGEVYQARNATTARMSVMASFLIPKGAPLSMAHPASAAPATLPRTGTTDFPWLAVSITALVSLLCGGLARHVMRRRD